MSKSFDVVYISTPRHGYFKVNGDDLREIKISQSFSEYSYFDEDNDVFYLEEDCDVSLFMKRCELDGIQVNVTDENYDSDQEENLIRCHNDALGGDYGYYGELEQNHTGLESFFEDESDEEDEEEVEE
jgi:hypothetical protein